MTRAEAIQLVSALGGSWASCVTGRTHLLIIGQEGWPLQKDGRLTAKLQKARTLQRQNRIEILSEDAFFNRLGLEPPVEKRWLTTAQLGALLGIRGESLREWVDLGLVQPRETILGMHYFDFRQVKCAKSLSDFIRSGITIQRVRRSLAQLRLWLPEVNEQIEALALVEKDGRLLVRLRAGALAEPSGQLHFDFGAGGQPTPYTIRGDSQAADWFHRGLLHEEKNRLAQAARCYRQALREREPDAQISFNLGNVLYRMDRKEQAAERFRQAVELDSDFAEAWNNLGNTLAELGEVDEATAAFRQALTLRPGYADAHYNLADLLNESNAASEARLHWQAYLREDQVSEWAQYARRCLGADA